MKRSSRSPTEDSLIGTILVENIPRRSVSNGEIMTWLKKYGDISEISIYKDCYVVQFESDLEAAGAVQCENGAQFFGSIVSVKHAEPGIMSALRRSGPPLNRFSTNSRRSVQSSNTRDRNRDRERDRDRDRDSDRDRDRQRSRPRERDRGRHHDDSPPDRRRRYDDRSPRRRSRSPASSRGDRRHVHPLNWLSEMAGTDSSSAKPATVTSPSRTPRGPSPPPPPPPYTVAIVAVQHDLVPYAETIEKRVSLGIRGPTQLRTHIVVLLSVEHLTPCLADLTRDRVPFAIICTTTNWSHGSCTLRILYVPKQQEHRNMPLDDAMTLLQKEYDTYLAVDKAPPASSAVSVAVPDGNVEEDHTFLAPSRNMVTLLRMLADSRILSIGELDEIAAFVQERKRRLEGRRSADSRNGTTSDLKSRILSMLYPPASANNSAAQLNAAGGSTTNTTTLQTGPVSNTSLNANNLQTISRLAGALPNPAIQQALDTLMMIPASQFPQPVPRPTSSSNAVPTAGALSQQQQSQSSYGKGTNLNMPQERGSGVVLAGGRMPYGSSPGPIKSGRGEMNSFHRTEEMHYIGGSQKPGDYPNAGNAPSVTFPAYKQPLSHQQQQQSTFYGNDSSLKSSQDSRGPAGGLNRRESDEQYQGMRTSGSNLLHIKDETHSGSQGHVTEEATPLSAPSWQRRKRGKRGGVGKSGAEANSRGTTTNLSNTGNRNPTDLMATSVAPVGHVAETYQYTWGSSYEHAGARIPASHGASQYSLAAGLHGVTDPYSNQPYGYTYPQPYY
ncbi:Nuclear receptor coactivator 5 [Fasciola hepatica]|uniref:Nuclear receptor coactivator 5 n=1 Tax=Fasciola hepatica TaxID=6192 RepID=A0A4E0RR75_FASHE|nr:Nuclear receptor coactivator 5 [Fasciola hepatica]